MGWWEPGKWAQERSGDIGMLAVLGTLLPCSSGSYAKCWE